MESRLKRILTCSLTVSFLMVVYHTYKATPGYTESAEHPAAMTKSDFEGISQLNVMHKDTVF